MKGRMRGRGEEEEEEGQQLKHGGGGELYYVTKEGENGRGKVANSQGNKTEK